VAARLLLEPPRHGEPQAQPHQRDQNQTADQLGQGEPPAEEDPHHDAVLEAIKKAGITTASDEIAMVPKNLTKLEGKNASAMLRLSEALEEHDDVQNVYGNYEVDEAEVEALA